MAAGWELNDQLGFLENDVSTRRMVELANGMNCTEPVG